MNIFTFPKTGQIDCFEILFLKSCANTLVFLAALNIFKELLVTQVDRSLRGDSKIRVSPRLRFEQAILREMSCNVKQ